MKILIQSCQAQSLKFFIFETQMIIQQTESQPHGTMRVFILSPDSQPTLSASCMVDALFVSPPMTDKARAYHGSCEYQSASISIPTFFCPQWLHTFWSLCGWIGPGSGPWSEGHLCHFIAPISSGMPGGHLRDGECSLSLGTSALSTCKDVSPW